MTNVWTPTYLKVLELARENGVTVDPDDPIGKFVDDISRLSDGIPEDKEFVDLVAQLAIAEVISHREMYAFATARHRELAAIQMSAAADKLNAAANRIQQGLEQGDLLTGGHEISTAIAEIEKVVESMQDVKDDPDWSDIVAYADTVLGNARGFLDMRERSLRGDPDATLKLLDKVPSLPPEPGDEMPE